jgi:hypothetical protein
VGSGGSRYGAGRPGWRRKCEQLLSLDIRRLHRKGLLNLSSEFSWRWTVDGEPCGRISIWARCDRLRLSYAWTSEDERRHLRYDVHIDRTSCHYGGSRAWFRCPRCSRRCAVLYGLSRRDGYFGCRRCLRLGYASEAEDSLSRLWRKQRKLEAKLNWIDGEIPERQKWMRQRTFDRILERIDAIEDAKDADFLGGMALVCRRLGMTTKDLFK